jgi:hypothetical protein
MADQERPEPRRQDYATAEEHKLAWNIWRAQNRDDLRTPAESRASLQALGEQLDLTPGQIADILGDWGK